MLPQQALNMRVYVIITFGLKGIDHFLNVYQ